jgi:hypothetical protein
VICLLLRSDAVSNSGAGIDQIAVGAVEHDTTYTCRSENYDRRR